MPKPHEQTRADEAREVDHANSLLLSDDIDDVQSGMKIIENRAKAGDMYSKYTMAKWYRTGFGGYPVDADKDKELTKASAEALVPDAVFDLGAKADGRALAQRKTALGYYIVSALMGDIDAMNAVLDIMKNTDTIGRNIDACSILEGYIRDVVTPYRNQQGLEFRKFRGHNT